MAAIQNSLKTVFSAADIVLSCTICQETLSSIYAKHDGNRGLRKSGDPHDGTITKLWLTECAHLICGKHLEGGGVPFHSEQQVPRAKCPLCTVEKKDHSEKSLFYVNGTSKGEYDDNIPDAYFQTPPVQFIDGNTGSEALRFQYLSLVRYGFKTYEKAARAAKALRVWENRRDEIIRSLRTVASLRDELLRAGRTLLSLDQDISSIEEVLNSVGTGLLRCSDHQSSPETLMERGANTSTSESSPKPFDVGSRLARGSAADLDALSKDPGSFRTPSRPNSAQEARPLTKRKRADSINDLGQQDGHDGGRGYDKGQSRDIMPPPPIPIRQPYVYMAQLDDNDLNEVLRRNQTGETNGLHSRSVPFTTDHQHHTSNPQHEYNACRGARLAAASSTANNHFNLAPSTIGTTPPRVSVNARPSPSLIQSRQIGQGNGAQHRTGQSSSSPAHSPYAVPQRHFQGYNHESLQVPLATEAKTYLQGPIFGCYGSGSSLGLSSKSRSSHRRPSQSPTQTGRPRRRLGDTPSASPHFQPRVLSNSTSRSLYTDSPSQLRRITSYASDATIPLGSLGSRPNGYDRNFFVEQEDRIEANRDRNARAFLVSDTETLVGSLCPKPFTHYISAPRAQDNHAWIDRGRAPLTDPQAPGFHRPDPSRGGPPTADPQASAARRRANR